MRVYFTTCSGVFTVNFEHVIAVWVTCSKATIETLQKGVKYIQCKYVKYVNDVVLVFLLLTLNIFHNFF